MSDIRKKISTITEADESDTIKAMGIHPVEEDSEPVKSVMASNVVKPVIGGAAALAGAASTSQNGQTNGGIQNNRLASIITDETVSTGWVTILITSFMLLWILTVGLITYQFLDLSNIQQYNAWQYTGLSLLVLVPLMAILLMGYGFKRLTDMSEHSRRLMRAADELTNIDEHITGRTSDMARNIVSEIQRIEDSLDHTTARIKDIGETLKEEISQVEETGATLEQSTDQIVRRLSTEREALTAISSSFETHMNNLSERLETHTKDLNINARLTEQKIEESQLGFKNSAQHINQAADTLKANSNDAAQTLQTKQVELNRLSEGLKLRADEVGSTYNEFLQNANNLIAEIRGEYEKLANLTHDRLEGLRDMSITAQVSAERLNLASQIGRKTVDSLSDAASLTQNSFDAEFERKKSARRNSSLEIDAKLKTKPAKRKKKSRKVHLRPAATENEPTENILRASPEINPPSLAKKLVAPLRATPQHMPANEAASLQISPDSKPNITIPRPDDLMFKHQTDDFAPDPTLPKPLKDSLPDNPLRRIDDFSTDGPLRDEETLNLNLDVANSDEFISPAYRGSNGTPNGAQGKSWWRSALRLGPARNKDYAIDMLVRGNSPQNNVSQSGYHSLANGTLSAATNISDIDTAQILDKLSQLGLAPSAIVDDGTILKAIEVRLHHGNRAMSNQTARRLGDPILHLRESLAIDPGLKDKAVQFAASFHANLATINNDPDALRQHLQSDNGRAFLLFDAALNI